MRLLNRRCLSAAVVAAVVGLVGALAPNAVAASGMDHKKGGPSGNIRQQSSAHFSKQKLVKKERGSRGGSRL